MEVRTLSLPPLLLTDVGSPPHVSVVQFIVLPSIAMTLSIVECNRVQFMLCAVCGSGGQL